MTTNSMFNTVVEKVLAQGTHFVPCTSLVQAQRLRYRFYSWRRAQRVLGNGDLPADRIEVKLSHTGLMFCLPRTSLDALAASLEGTISNAQG